MMSSEPLGIHTKYVSTSRARNYRLQVIAARLLPGERVSWCSRQAKAPVIEIRRAGESVFYHGLAKCGSAWICPVCAARVSAGRRAELERAVSSGFSALIVTLTLQHTRDDRLKELLEALSLAWRKTRAGRAWQVLEAKYKIVASATSTEITYSRGAGFHPHKHAVLFSQLPENELDIAEFERELSARWRAALGRLGEYGSEFYALKVTRGAAGYLAKWSAAHELTSQNKSAGDEHLTMWQVLELAASDAHYAHVFREYAKATKGKRLLVWSKNARQVLGLEDEQSDEAIAEQEPVESELIAELTLSEWRLVCKLEQRGELLERAAKDGEAGVLLFLEKLREVQDEHV